MDPLTRVALDDLRAKFGDKAVLTTSELARAIGLTAGAINTIIYRNRKGEGSRFPLEPMPFPVGGGYGYSIYQVAELRACPEFCVNGPLAGNCRLVRRHHEYQDTRRT